MYIKIHVIYKGSVPGMIDTIEEKYLMINRIISFNKGMEDGGWIDYDNGSNEPSYFPTVETPEEIAELIISAGGW